MAFENREGGKYFTIMGGKIVVRVSAETPGAIARVNKEGRTVHELKHDSFTGKLVNIRLRDGNYGKQWEFDFRDGGELYTLQLMYSNSYATALLKILPNIDFNQEMKVQPSETLRTDGSGKKNSSVFVSQDGKTLKHAYTKESPNGLPDMEQVQVKGQMVWDDTKRLAFLEDMVKTKILPQLPQDTTAPAAAAAPATGGLEDEFANENPLGATGSDDDDF